MKNRSLKIILILVFGCLAVTSAKDTYGATAKQDTLVVSHTGIKPVLTDYLLVTESNKMLAIKKVADELPANAFYKIDPRKGFSKQVDVASHYWLKLCLRNASPIDTTIYLQFNSQVIDTATCFKESTPGHFVKVSHTGTDLFFEQRVLPTYDNVFPITLKPGETQNLVIQIDTDDGDEIHMFPELTAFNSFHAAEQRFYFVIGVMTCLMFTVSLLSLLLRIALKKKIFSLYCAYALVALYEIYTMTGADLQYIYPHLPDLSGALQELSPCLLGILMTFIMQNFLEHKNRPTIFKIPANVGLGLIILMTIVCVVIDRFFQDARTAAGYAQIFLASVLFLQCILFIACAVERIIQKYRPAIFYLVAIFFFDLGLIQYILMVIFNINQESVVKSCPNMIEFGIAFETVVVFIGLVYRYRLDAKEKEELQVLSYQLAIQRQQEIAVQEQERRELIAAQEEKLREQVAEAEAGEQARIARDLHDDVNSTLSSLSLLLSNALTDATGEMEVLLSKTISLTNKAFYDIRAIAHNLLAADVTEDGLFATIEDLISPLNSGGKIHFTLATSGDDSKLSTVVAVNLSRIIKEMVNNIRRHSQATIATISIQVTSDSLQVIAEDNGVGIDNVPDKPKGIGLKNMQTRMALLKGELLFGSVVQGTQITINIPL